MPGSCAPHVSCGVARSGREWLIFSEARLHRAGHVPVLSSRKTKSVMETDCLENALSEANIRSWAFSGKRAVSSVWGKDALRARVLRWGPLRV